MSSMNVPSFMALTCRIFALCQPLTTSRAEQRERERGRGLAAHQHLTHSTSRHLAGWTSSWTLERFNI